ncbi:high frequency lysogenization protein HflD [Amphritea balenae]|uniref:High frequency lysogenization protein HflD homolog n=1 Tax=Amphritea balenae TaxID=452629 RepID=A0A3P1SKU4_9GAMM|nr:high frequency lysogenization protein HflD [Amphritea balenae]RRC97901.1 lysogenization regulator HflD [Amphritea balenae]GGK81602.1 high frequency lysogenization protein HflD [Amphritea balenae]
MSRANDQQAIALAGLFQAASLVEQIATRGMVPQNSFETSLASIFVTNPDSTEQIYGGADDLPANLSLGFRGLEELLDKSRTEQNQDVIRYGLSIMHLEKKLSKRPDLLQSIGERIDQISQQASYFAEADTDLTENPAVFTHPSVVANIASLYQDTLSTFNFRIQVTGEPRHLQNAENAAKIRALLLAGVRAAMLWRQMGGKRWHLLFFKSRLRPSVKRISKRR